MIDTHTLCLHNNNHQFSCINDGIIRFIFIAWDRIKLKFHPFTDKNGPGSVSKTTTDNQYVRKGAIIGVYFESMYTKRLPIIGQFTSSDHSVCKLQGSLTETTTINCTSNMFPNLIIKAQMEISMIAFLWDVCFCNFSLLVLLVFQVSLSVIFLL